MKKSYKYRLLSLPTITLLALGIILSSSIVSADDNTSVVDEINITVPIACTMSGTGQNSHNANINNGLYVPDIGTTTLHAFCNDNEGFAIYAAGYTGNEVGGTNSNKLVGTNVSGNATIESGIATTAGNPDISNWAMKLAITQDSGDTTGTNAFTIDSAPNVSLPSQAEQSATQASFSSYHVVPNEYTKVAHKNSGTDMTDTTGGVKLTTTYAAYISKTQPADTYSGQVIYTLVHPANAEAPLVCNPNATSISQAKCMQDFAANGEQIASTMTLGTQYALVDMRDRKTYTIAKFTDGNVWMTQNLDLDLDSNTTYTNLDTDLGWNTSTNQYDTATWNPIRSTYDIAANNIHAWCQGGTWNSQDGCERNYTPESYNPGNLYWNSETSDWSDWNAYYDSCDHATNTLSCDESLNPLSAYVSSAGVAQYHLGNYYNWTAAIAMNDSSSLSRSGEIIEQSICPTGWKLPYAIYNRYTYQSEGDFANLWNEYGLIDNTSDISAIWSNPLFFTPSGHYNGSLENIGYEGTFYASTAAYSADFDTGGHIMAGANQNAEDGRTLRCVLR